MDPQMERYLRPTFVINSDHPAVAGKSNELTQGKQDEIEKAKSLFYFVRNEIKYNIYVSKSNAEDFQASNTLARKYGYCVQKSVLLAALARAAGIPAGLGFARIRNNLLPEKALNFLGGNIMPFHGYAELYLGGKWVKATPSFDLGLCERLRLNPVEFDGKTNAMLNTHNLDGKLHIEYLEFLGEHYDDVPLIKLWDTLIKTLGRKSLEPPEQ